MYRVFDLPSLILFPKIDVKSNVNEDSINLAFILIQERPCKLRVYCINLLMMEIWRFSCNYRCSLPNGRLKSTTLMGSPVIFMCQYIHLQRKEQLELDKNLTVVLSPYLVEDNPCGPDRVLDGNSCSESHSKIFIGELFYCDKCWIDNKDSNCLNICLLQLYYFRILY